MFGPVVEKPNTTAFITEDPTTLLLNGKFHDVPILATYTDRERLLLATSEELQRKSGKLNKPVSLELEDLIHHRIKSKIDKVSFNELSFEMERVYPSNNLFEKTCLVSESSIIILVIYLILSGNYV